MPTGWKCTTRTIWWNGCSGCVASGRPTSITATSSARWCASPGFCPLPLPGAVFPSLTFKLAYDALREWRGERADAEYVRILHLAATTMESTVDSALTLLLETGRPFDYAEVRDLRSPSRPRPRRSPCRASRTWESTTPCCRGGLMTDPALMQERIGQLCHQFKLSTMGARSVSCFTAAGHGEAPETLLEVLKKVAEDRRHRRMTGCARSPGYPRARPWRHSTSNGYRWCSGSNRTNWHKAASWNWASRADLSVTFLNEATGIGKNA